MKITKGTHKWFFQKCFEVSSIPDPYFFSYHGKLKGIVHFEMIFWYVLAYVKGIQDVGVFVSTVFSILIFLGQTVLVCQSYNGGTVGSSSKSMHREVQIKHDLMTRKCKYTLMA